MMPVVQILTDTGFLPCAGVRRYRGFTWPDNRWSNAGFPVVCSTILCPIQDLTSMYTDLQQSMASGVRIF